jgi:subtilase family serine protease
VRYTLRFGILATITLCLIACYSQPSAQTVQLPGMVSPEALKLPNYGDLPYSQSLLLQIWFKPHHQEQLIKLLADQQNRKSPQYHKWLTQPEYTSRFRVTQQEFNKVFNELASNPLITSVGGTSL